MRRLLNVVFAFAIMGVIAQGLAAMAMAAWGGQQLVDPVLIAKLRRIQFQSEEDAVDKGQSSSPRWVRTVYTNTCGDVIDVIPQLSPDKSSLYRSPELVRTHHAGWPFRSLTAHQDIDEISGATVTHGGRALRRPLSVGWDQKYLTGTPRVGFAIGRVLPLTPLWLGTLLNTVIYGLCLLIVLRGFGMARSCLRVLRGLCGACGYPIGVSAVCTECGRAVNRNRFGRQPKQIAKLTA